MRSVWIAMAILAVGLIVLLASGSGGSVLGLSTDSFGRLVYLSALGAVLCTGILFSGQRFGHTVRLLAIWLLVILALMAGYQYRYELQDVASRVSGGLVPGSPLSITDADGRATITLQKRMDGHFVAEVGINGRTVNAMIDTGATSTVLTYEDAVKAGFDPGVLHFNIPVSTANGVTNAARVVADEISVGGVVRRNVPLLVANPAGSDRACSA